jgi:sortase family protein
VTRVDLRAGAAVLLRPPAPAGRHAVDPGRAWSGGRVWRGCLGLARRRAAGRPAVAVLAACSLLISVMAAGGLVIASHNGHAATPLGVTPFVAVPAGRAATLPDQADQADQADQPDPVQVAAPVALIIPAIGVSTRLVRLGRTAAGTLQVPSTTAVAGWYTGGPRPGELGAAVVAGHVDSYAGPGVFFRLRLLRPHDLIFVRRADGSLAVFRVFAVRLYAKSGFPTAAVYGAVPVAELRVITCGGTFDPATGHYLSNVIVFAIAVRWSHG